MMCGQIALHLCAETQPQLNWPFLSNKIHRLQNRLPLPPSIFLPYVALHLIICHLPLLRLRWCIFFPFESPVLFPVIPSFTVLCTRCSDIVPFLSKKQDFSAYLAFSGIVLHNAQLYETSQLENRRNQVGVDVCLPEARALHACGHSSWTRCIPQVLLDLASLIFEEQQCLEVLLRKFAGTILSFMQAQACTVFITDEDSMVSLHTHTHTHRHIYTPTLSEEMHNLQWLAKVFSPLELFNILSHYNHKHKCILIGFCVIDQ